MATNPLSVQLPQPQVPFLDPSGGVSKVWIYYFLTLLNRTGGVNGISVAGLQDQINTLFGEIASLEVSIADADIPFAEPPPSIPAGVFFVDEPPPPPINPYLAALLMQDIS